MVIRSHSVQDTLAAARRLVEQLCATRIEQTCVALAGELGAGKTTFVRGLVEALGGAPRDVSSPTFVLLHTYNCHSLRVHHLDAYRVAGEDDFAAIGFEELLEDEDAIVVVEWPEKIAGLLRSAKRLVEVRLSPGDAENERRIEF